MTVTQRPAREDAVEKEIGRLIDKGGSEADAAGGLEENSAAGSEGSAGARGGSGGGEAGSDDKAALDSRGAVREVGEGRPLGSSI